MDNNKIETKVCNNCKEAKSFNEFNKNTRCLYGLNNWCKLCLKTYNKKRYAKNRDLYNNKVKQWHSENPEKNTEYQRNFRNKNEPNRNRRPRIPPETEIPDEIIPEF